MEITISSSLLASRLSIITKAINKKSVMPILGDVVFHIEGSSTLTLIGGSEEVNVRMKITDFQADDSGFFAVSGDMMTTAVKNLPEQPIKLVAKEGQLTVMYNNGHFKLPITAMNGIDEYPTVGKLADNRTEYDITTSELQRIVAYTSPMTSDNELHPQLQGIFCGVSATSREFVGTDGHVLAKTTIGNEDALAASFIMPKSVCLLVGVALQGETTHVRFDDRVAEVETDGCKITFLQIVGRFPNYNSVIPKGEHTATLDREAFVNALRRTSVFVGDNELIVLDLQGHASRLVLSGENVDFYTSGRESVPCACDEDMRIGVKSSNISALMKCLSGNELSMQYTTPSRPVVFTENNDNTHITALAMPMIIEE